MDILIVDDEASIRRATSLALDAAGHYVETAETGAVALRSLKESSFDLVLLDLYLGEESGLQILETIRREHPSVHVVIFTANATIPNAIEATRLGAVDFLEKPFSPDQLRQALKRIATLRTLERKVEELTTEVRTHTPPPQVMSKNPGLQRQIDVLFRAADTQASILILGESGTGKSMIARAIHEQSPFRDKPFVTVSCPSLSRELLESDLFGHVKGSFTGAMRDTWGKVKAAEGGTLFLDEIGELPLEIQPKLLRLLQEREYERLGETTPRKANVRVIAATNRDLKQWSSEGRFREDLFYRLNVISATMPPLRERPEDLFACADSFLKFFADQFRRKVRRFSPAAYLALRNHPWPGNIRELRNAIERAVILAEGDEITPRDLPEAGGSTTLNGHDHGAEVGQRVSIEKLECEHIRRVMAITDSLQEAAEVLGIDAATLYRKRKRYQLDT
ncbi:sigma-54-dependent response regulator transcription factor AlgB [Prosthecobacter algae]|uniref:Sigma-54-dependent response regulator transcription factor AlgB n=1 Tax=Prosthecobacter algae TaxID=1144682 RepID=A0ABP9NZT2_9BACT